MSQSQIYHLYRKKTCSWGEKAKNLLEGQGKIYKEHFFEDKDSENEFKAKFQVNTTPQIFLDKKNIGGFTDLAAYFGISPNKAEEKKKTYTPIIAVFSVALLLTLATDYGISGFMGFSLSLLACLKLMDLSVFVSGFKKYDFITQKIHAYGVAYPFFELAVGLGFLSGVFPLLTGAISTFIGLVGSYSVIKKVYLEKVDLNCACVGGNSNVPLGFVSFIENAMMLLMGVLLLAAHYF